MTDDELMFEGLRAIRKWADIKIVSGGEPPWAWKEYMDLRKAVDAVLESKGGTITKKPVPDNKEEHPNLVVLPGGRND